MLAVCEVNVCPQVRISEVPDFYKIWYIATCTAKFHFVAYNRIMSASNEHRTSEEITSCHYDCQLLFQQIFDMVTT
jgi:hypothetical protein